MMRKVKFEYRITALYIVLGGLWIIFSDSLLNSFINDKDLLSSMQTYKGWFFVLVTSLIFFSILKRHLHRLRDAEFKARESDSLKTAFLRNISHEIRTPMNGIIGFTALLNADGIPENKKSEYLKIISNSSNHLLGIVNDILDISLIETGNVMVNEKKVNLNRILHEVKSQFDQQIGPEVEFTIRKGLSDSDSWIMTDELMLKKVLTNITGNAHKFTQKGHIRLGYELKDSNIEFCVEDTGIGIPEEFMPNIFKRFQKADTLQAQFYEGLGLGLSICKGSLELLHGKIWVNSIPGKGSKFYFTIPYIPAA